MRYQHREIGEKIRFLDELAAAPEPDTERFRTKLNSLLHHMWAHVDTETNTIAALVVGDELERRRRADGVATAARAGRDWPRVLGAGSGALWPARSGAPGL